MSDLSDAPFGQVVVGSAMVAAPIYFIVTYWYIVLIVVAVAAIVLLIGWAVYELTGIRDEKARKKAAIKRAESQHAKLMDGDESAIYGNYPPVAIPFYLDPLSPIPKPIPYHP